MNKKISKKFLLTIPFIIITLLFLVLPMIMIFVRSFIPTDGNTVADNWNYIDDFVWKKILISLFDAFATTLIVILISYPFAYFLAFNCSKTTRSIAILLVTAPVWTSFLVKLIGLKTFFDAINGYENSTSGEIFTIIGLVYLYTPFMILPLYNTLIELPKNLIFASKDLGRGNFNTFINVVVPYTKAALFSGITLVFLPSLTTVAVPQFLNASPSGSLIGDILMEEGQLALTSDISLARASSLSLVLLLIMTVGYVLFIFGRKMYNRSRKGNTR